MLKREKLEELLKHFPGVGPRQAKRFAYFLLYKNTRYTDELATLITNIKQETQRCSQCNRFFENSESLNSACNICTDIQKSQEAILILNTNQDLENIVLSKVWDGLFFLIGGNLRLTDKNPENSINLYPLIKRIKNKEIKEITFALSLNPEGEHTKNYIKTILEPLVEEYGFQMFELGRGLSLGSEIEYSDKVTLHDAFRNRS